MHTEDQKSRAYSDACVEQRWSTESLQYTSEGALSWACFNAGYKLASSLPAANMAQIGWCGPFGIVPGGMDNEPAENWAPIYTLATPAVELQILRDTEEGNAHDSPEATPALLSSGGPDTDNQPATHCLSCDYSNLTVDFGDKCPECGSKELEQWQPEAGVSAEVLENLLRRAAAAHEGPYSVEILGNRTRWFKTNGGRNVQRQLLSEYELNELRAEYAQLHRATDAYTAAADPQTVTAIINELLALRAAPVSTSLGGATAEIAGYHSTELADISNIISWLHAQNRPMGELVRRFYNDATRGKRITEYNDIDPLPALPLGEHPTTVATEGGADSRKGVQGE